jgi:hypothetical protein
MEPDMSQDQNDYQPMPSIAEMFGELDNDVPTFQDQPQAPGPRSSAARHAGRYKANSQAAALDRVDDVVDLAVGIEADRRAYERTTANPAKASTNDKIRTARYARSQGLVPTRSSAERLAAPSLAQRQWQPVDNDNDRRHGRRPRG